MPKKKLKIKVFHSFEEQEKADVQYWRRVSPSARVEALDLMRRNYLKLIYGRVPRLRRVIKVIKRT
jgi:hypothetical protein